jgi:peptide/nickel transport system permease protein
MSGISLERTEPLAITRRPRDARRDFLRRHPTVVVGGAVILAMATVSVGAPWLTPYGPFHLDVFHRLKPPSTEHWFGTDGYGRDVFARTLYGGRISLLVGFGVVALSLFFGTLIGMISGYIRHLDGVLMRIMDGLMAIPGILLAIAMVALMQPSVLLVILALSVAETPRVVRLVRGLVLSIREQPYVEAAVSIGTQTPRMLLKHLLPNMVPPLIVQGTYVCALAVLGEATLSFLGVGTPPEIPSWGNIISESQLYVQVAIWTIFFPGLFLGALVLAINMLGDGLRDLLDARLARKM